MRKKILLLSFLVTGSAYCPSNYELIKAVNQRLRAIETAQTVAQVEQLQAEAQPFIDELKRNGALSGDSYPKTFKIEATQAKERIQESELPVQKPERPLPATPVKQAPPPPVPPAGPPSTDTSAADKPVENIPPQKQQLLEQIRAGKVLKKAPAPVKVPSEQLKADIQSSPPLKKVAPPAPRKPEHELAKPLQMQMDDEGRKQKLEDLQRQEKERLEQLEGAEGWEE